jgi:hypothetical protein
MTLLQTIMTGLIHKTTSITTLVVSSALLLAGCVQINTPQIDTIYQMMVPPVDPLDKHRWNLEVGDYKSQVYLLSIDGESVFANENKDILVLRDGTLVSISLPTVTDATITIIDNSYKAKSNNVTEQNKLIRSITVNDTLYETQQCGKWKNTTLDSNNNSINKNKEEFLSIPNGKMIEDIQQRFLLCVGAKTQLHILKYISGELQSLSQYVPYIDQQISLTKVSKR